MRGLMITFTLVVNATLQLGVDDNPAPTKQAEGKLFPIELACGMSHVSRYQRVQSGGPHERHP